MTGSVLGGSLGGVAAVSPHVDREGGRAEEGLVAQQGRGDLVAGVLVGADGDVEQVEVRAVGVQAVDVSPHDLRTGGTGVAGHFEHAVSHHLGHLDDRVNADTLVGGVPPALVARKDSAESGHLVAEVRGERAAGRADGIGDIQQVGGAFELVGIILDAGAVAGILQRGQQVVVRQVEGRVGELGGSGAEREAVLLEGRDDGARSSLIIALRGVQASDLHRDGELAVSVEADEVIGALDAAHQRERQVGSAVVGVAEQLGGDAHILTDIGLALLAVAEEQVGDTGSGLLELQTGGKRLVQQVHAPNDSVLAVLRHGHFHRDVGVDLEGQNAVIGGALDLGGRAVSRGQPAALGRGALNGGDERADLFGAGVAHIEREDSAGRDLGGAAVDDVLKGLVAFAQCHTGAGGQQAERLAAVSGKVHLNAGRPGLRVADDHGEAGVGGVGRDRGLLAVEGLVGPVVVEAGVSGVVGDIHVGQGVVHGGNAGVAVLIGTHDDADAAVELHAGVHQRLGGEERGKAGTAVVLNACAVEPAVLDIRGVVSGGIQLTLGVDPAGQVAGGIVGSGGGIEMAERHDHFGGVGITDLDVNVLVVLTLNHVKAEVCGKLLDPRELGGLSVTLVVVGLGVGDGEGVLAGRAAGSSGAVGNGVVARTGRQTADQGVGIIGAVADDHIANITAEIFNSGVDLRALGVGHGRLIGDVRGELIAVGGLVALLALEVDAGVLDERAERSVAEVQINAGVSAVLERVALGVPLQRQREEAVLMLDGLDDAVRGAGNDGQALAEILGIDRLMMRGGDQVNALDVAEDLAEPLGLAVIDGDALVVSAAGKLMIGSAAAVDQTVHPNAQVAVFAVLAVDVVIRAVDDFPRVGVTGDDGRGAELFLDGLREVVHRVAGVLNGIFENFGQGGILVLSQLFQSKIIRCGRAGENGRHAIDCDLTVQDLLAEVVGDILNELAAHGDVEALLTAADGQHRHVERHGLLHQKDVRGVAGISRAAGAVRGLELAVEVRVPVGAAGHKDTVEVIEHRSRLGLSGDLGQVDRQGAVAFVGLSEALIVSADLGALPGDTDHGTLAHAGHFDRGEILAVHPEVRGHCLAERALAGQIAVNDLRGIGSAHHALQRFKGADAVVGLVGHGDVRADGGLVNAVVLEFIIAVDLIENRILHQRAGGSSVRRARFGSKNASRHHAEQHNNRQQKTGRAG